MKKILFTLVITMITSSGYSQNVSVKDINYSGHNGESVPAFLIEPVRQTLPMPAVIFLHPASGDRNSILQEAKQLADNGYVVLIPDAPFRRPGFAKTQFSSDLLRRAFIYDQWIQDAKVAIGILLKRKDVNRVGLVGRNLGGGMATVVANDSRIKASVIIGAIPSLARHAAWAARTANEAQKIYQTLLPYDPLNKVGNIKGKLFIQYGDHDIFFDRQEAEEYEVAAPPGTLVKWYNEGHGLNSKDVKSDYTKWLKKNL